MTFNGIDISNWQRGIDLSKVPCDFVIAKATEGTGYVDKSCDGFIQQALKLLRVELKDYLPILLAIL